MPTQTVYTGVGPALSHVARLLQAAGLISGRGCGSIRLSGKPRRQMPERVARLKAFRMRGEVSGKLIFSVRPAATVSIAEPKAVGPCRQSAAHDNKLQAAVFRACVSLLSPRFDLLRCVLLTDNFWPYKERI
jgi:hypothetical protein